MISNICNDMIIFFINKLFYKFGNIFIFFVVIFNYNTILEFATKYIQKMIELEIKFFLSKR